MLLLLKSDKSYWIDWLAAVPDFKMEMWTICSSARITDNSDRFARFYKIAYAFEDA